MSFLWFLDRGERLCLLRVASEFHKRLSGVGHFSLASPHLSIALFLADHVILLKLRRQTQESEFKFLRPGTRRIHRSRTLFGTSELQSARTGLFIVRPSVAADAGRSYF
jgi:hypothetical protein